MTTGISWGRVTENDRIHENVIIIGSGPSLIGFDFNKLRGKGMIIAVNNAVNSVNFADIWFTLDPWGLDGPQLPGTQFSGRLFAAVSEDYGTRNAQIAQHRVTPDPRITFLHRLRSHNKVGVSSETAYKLGLSEDNSCINTGNSGYGALNLAYHLRPKRILLLGIDGTIGYFYTNKSKNRPLTYLPEMFESAKDQLDNADIKVINGSVNSSITAYPRFTINEGIEELSK